MSRNPLSSSSRSVISHRRTNSAPPPTIEVEDVSHPLTSAEDLDDERPIRPISKSRTTGPLGAGYRHGRRPSPSIAWRKKWSREHDPFKDGRVLIVDLLTREQSEDKRRQTQAHELTNINELSKFYEKGSEKKIAPCLRIIHVQNSLWARDFLFKKYGIINPENPALDRPGNAFSRWAMWEKPQKRAGRPVLNAKAFSLDKSPLRNIWRTGFGVDYLRYFNPDHMAQSLGNRGDESNYEEFKLLELNKWIEAPGSDSFSAHGLDVYVQRLSVYIQRNMDDAGLVNEDWHATAATYAPRDSEELERVERAEKEENLEMAETANTQQNKWQGLRAKFDNGTTIIVFESSHSGLVRDTLIEARAEVERKWRRIFTDLTRDDIESDSLLALECLDYTINYILQGLTGSWEKLLSKCEEHVDILEEKIYESPADESRAPELWGNQSLWLKMEKLLFVQMETVNTLRQYLRDLAMDSREFLKETPDQFKRIETLIDEELNKPTANLNDLVYKSVAIRDSRQSIQLGVSMWRLSWITIVFLPLTFISGFFGMNVDIFQPGGQSPSIRWYFIAVIPLMLLVVLCFYILKKTPSIRREDPSRRGAFEAVCYQFAVEHPTLWSRNGPRKYIRPQGLFSRLKWSLMCYWFAPSRTSEGQPLADINDIGVFAHVKHFFARRWLNSIAVHPDDMLSAAERGEEVGDFGTVMQLLGVATPIAMADGSPLVTAEISRSSSRRKLSRRRRGSSQSSSGSTRRRYFRSSSPNASLGQRSGSPASEGMVCEEEDGSRDDGDFDWERGRVDAEERVERRGRPDPNPTTEGASALLAVPPVSRQVLTRSGQSE